MCTTSFGSMIMSFEAYLTSKLASKNVGFQLLNYPLCLSFEENNALWPLSVTLPQKVRLFKATHRLSRQRESTLFQIYIFCPKTRIVVKWTLI